MQPDKVNFSTEAQKSSTTPEPVTEAILTETLRKYGVLKEYSRMRVDEFSLSGPMNWRDGGFMLTGIQGSGKSCLAGAILRDRLYPDHPKTLARIGSSGQWTWSNNAIAWYYALELPRKIMDSWGRERESTAMNDVLHYKIIVIDDLGSEKTNEHTLPIMREIVEKCVNDGIDLIVTTNLTFSDLAKKDARLASRLSRLTPIDLPEVDMRWEQHKKKQRITARPQFSK